MNKNVVKLKTLCKVKVKTEADYTAKKSYERTEYDVKYELYLSHYVPEAR